VFVSQQDAEGHIHSIVFRNNDHQNGCLQKSPYNKWYFW